MYCILNIFNIHTHFHPFTIVGFMFIPSKCSIFFYILFVYIKCNMKLYTLSVTLCTVLKKPPNFAKVMEYKSGDNYCGNGDVI